MLKVRVQSDASPMDILKALEKNATTLEVYKRKNESMFKKIDKQFKNFFRKFLK
jgi:hypothetical protein